MRPSDFLLPTWSQYTKNTLTLAKNVSVANQLIWFGEYSSHWIVENELKKGTDTHDIKAEIMNTYIFMDYHNMVFFVRIYMQIYILYCNVENKLTTI